MSKGRNLAKLLVSNTGSIGSSALATVLDTAPAQLDTLKELASALANDANFAVTVNTSLSGKQATLVSGTNIKSLNSTSLLGSGNIAVQPTLVSGTNIKTVNGNSLLGSGDITISGGSSLTGLTQDTVYNGSAPYGNTILGYSAYASGNNNNTRFNVVVGVNAYSTWYESVALGYNAKAEGAQVLSIGVNARTKTDQTMAVGSNAGI